MKKVKFEGKLSLNKKTIANLNKNQMKNIKGGEGILPPILSILGRTCHAACDSCCNGTWCR